MDFKRAVLRRADDGGWASVARSRLPLGITARCAEFDVARLNESRRFALCVEEVDAHEPTRPPVGIDAERARIQAHRAGSRGAPNDGRRRNRRSSRAEHDRAEHDRILNAERVSQMTGSPDDILPRALQGARHLRERVHDRYL